MTGKQQGLQRGVGVRVGVRDGIRVGIQDGGRVRDPVGIPGIILGDLLALRGVCRHGVSLCPLCPVPGAERCGFALMMPFSG
ncbi:hypothetical protein D3C72_1768470 [compost metagenome]